MSLHRIGAKSLAGLLGTWRDDVFTGPSYKRLADRLRLLIMDGRLPVGARLPGERNLAASLGLSRTTIAAAFAALRDEGFIESRPGAGARTRLPSRNGERPTGGDLEEGSQLVDFATAASPAGPEVHKAYAEALERMPAYLTATGYDLLGLGSLRTAIAERYTRRGLPTAVDQILITSGSLHGFALLLRALAGPGDRVLIDHPTFPRAIDAVQRAMCIPLPVSLPGVGWDEEGIVAAFRQGAPRVAYLIPDFHNPTGRCMSPACRANLARAAADARVTLVFDETLIDLALDEVLAETMVSTEEDVVRLGSTGKSFWGGLRVGWVRGNRNLISMLAQARASIDLGIPVLEQLAAENLIRTDAGLPSRRAQLRTQRDVLVEQVAMRLPDWRIDVPAGGLSVWAELPAPVSSALTVAAELHGIRLTSGPRFGVHGAFERFIRLPFTQPISVIQSSIQSIARAYDAVAPVIDARRRYPPSVV